MKALITGGAGFVGSTLADFLTEKGHDITIMDNLSRKGVDSNLKWLHSKYPELNFIRHDIRHPLDQHAKECDVIFHTAAQTAVTTSLENPREDFEINAAGTLNVLEACRRHDCAIVFCSTNKVYGNNVNSIPLSETGKRYSFKGIRGITEDFSIDAAEHTPYGCSKLAADQYVRDYGDVYGLRTVVNRMSCIYGEHQFGTTDQGWVTHFIVSAVLSRPVTVYGDGRQVRDILYGKDLAELFELQALGNKSGVFNVGGGPENTLSLLELIELLENLTGKKMTVSFADWRPADQRVYCSNIGKACSAFSWKPATAISKGVKSVLEWVNANKSLFS